MTALLICALVGAAIGFYLGFRDGYLDGLKRTGEIWREAVRSGVDLCLADNAGYPKTNGDEE